MDGRGGDGDRRRTVRTRTTISTVRYSLLLLSMSSSDSLYIPVSVLSWDMTLARIQSGELGVTCIAARSSGWALAVVSKQPEVLRKLDVRTGCVAFLVGCGRKG